MIISAPPHLPVEKGQQDIPLADDGGLNGRVHIDHIIKRSKEFLKPNGMVILHHASYLGVEKKLGNSPCTYSSMHESGISNPRVLTRNWLRASDLFIKTMPYIFSLYPKANDLFFNVKGV